MLLALIRKELLALSRDLHGLSALFILPVIFIVVMSMALKDVYSPHIDNLPWAVLDQDQSTLAQSLVTLWQQDHGKPAELPANWHSALSEGSLKYVLKIEQGAADDLRQTGKPDHQRLVILTDPGLDFGVFTSLRAQLQAIATTMRVEILIKKLAMGRAQIDVKGEALSGAQVAGAERINAGPRPTSVQHNVPAWLVFGMFFVMTTIAGLFVEERSCGAFNRLLSLGVSPWYLLFSKVVPYMLINAIQAGLMLSVGVLLMPLLGGDALSLQGISWPALIVMIMAISLAAISMALLVATLVKSQAQASTIGPMLTILMAAIGGIMIPTFVMPAAMQQLSRCSPMNWALEGLLNVLLRGGDLGSIEHQVSLLLLLAGSAITLAYFIFRFKKS